MFNKSFFLGLLFGLILLGGYFIFDNFIFPDTMRKPNNSNLSRETTGMDRERSAVMLEQKKQMEEGLEGDEENTEKIEEVGEPEDEANNNL